MLGIFPFDGGDGFELETYRPISVLPSLFQILKDTV